MENSKFSYSNKFNQYRTLQSINNEHKYNQNNKDKISLDDLENTRKLKVSKTFKNYRKKNWTS